MQARRIFVAMDVPPPPYQLTEEVCSGPTRHCSGGDVRCVQQAQKDGYVGVRLYEFCKSDDIHTVPRPTGVVLALSLLAVLGCAVWLGLRAVRRRKA
jgi:hypothetical protein